jgi:hypothetical protein
MTRVINVLVFPCGSESAVELHSSLSQCVNIRLFGASSRDDHGRFVYRNYIAGVPFIRDPGFVDAFNRILTDHAIDVVFPLHEDVVLFLSERRDQIKSRVVLGDRQTCRVCRDKRLTHEALSKYGLCPSLYSCTDDSKEFPVFLKPPDGQGGQRTQVARCQEEVDFALKRDPSLLVFEYLPGQELTVDCFTDRHGSLRFVGPRARERVRAGISVRSRAVEPSTEVRRMAEAINNELRFRGLWFFQVKQNKLGTYKLLEVASRTAGTMNLYRCLGVNFALLSVYDAMDMDVEILRNEYPIVVDRALVNRYEIQYEYDTVYLDYDDTLIVRDEVNSVLMMYLYQLLNKKKDVVLLTQHEGNVLEDMARRRIDPGLFSAIIHLEKGQRKSQFITSSKSIFIDNAFAERMKVAKEKGIPVFDVDAVQSLLDWRL